MIEIAHNPRKFPGRNCITTDSECEAAGVGLDYLTLDMQVVAKARLEDPGNLTKRYAGLWHRELDLAGPGISEIPLGGVGTCGALQAAQFIEQPIGYKLARHAPCDKRGRSVEGFHHYGARIESVADQDCAANADYRRYQNHEQLQPHSKPIAKAPEFEQLQVDGALLVQVFSLNFYETALSAKVNRSLLGQLGIALGHVGGERRSSWIQGGLGDRGFGSEIITRAQDF
jgi:hypothetical protein